MRGPDAKSDQAETSRWKVKLQLSEMPEVEKQVSSGLVVTDLLRKILFQIGPRDEIRIGMAGDRRQGKLK